MRILRTLVLSCLASCSGTPTQYSKTVVVSQLVTYVVDGVKCTGYLAYDSMRKGQRPGVLVVHEWWGHNDYVRRRARMLAGLGYTALALDMYGDGKVAEHPQDAQKFMMEVFSNMDVGVKRFTAAKKLLADHATTDGSRIAAIGYCFGGAVVLHMARTGMDLRGVASFHGNLATKSPARPGAIKAAVMVCHGADDAMAPPAQVAGFKEEMSTAGAELDFHTYPNAKHGFTNPDATANGAKFGIPLAYDQNADRASWASLIEFLAGVFQ